MNHRDLESWAIRAAQELQELADDAEEAVPESERDTVAISAKALIAEFDSIFNDRPLWQSEICKRS